MTDEPNRTDESKPRVPSPMIKKLIKDALAGNVKEERHSVTVYLPLTLHTKIEKTRAIMQMKRQEFLLMLVEEGWIQFNAALSDDEKKALGL